MTLAVDPCHGRGMIHEMDQILGKGLAALMLLV